MKPFRKHVAVAIDGGGMRGLMVTRALAILEDKLGFTCRDIFGLTAGTSTGSIISAGIAAGIPAQRMSELYIELGETIFPTTWRKLLFPLTRYRYPEKPLADALTRHFGDTVMGDFWQADNQMDVVITAYDLAENTTRFIKPWKAQYAQWPVRKAVQASCTVPTYFPTLEGRYIDGGVGSYGNPCYIAAYEAKECLDWDVRETTLISIGTGRNPYAYDSNHPPKLWAWDWIGRALDVFSQSAADQQVHLVENYFPALDFRRFQVDLKAPVAMDATDQMEMLLSYGTTLGRMILNDETDSAQGIAIKQVPR